MNIYSKLPEDLVLSLIHDVEQEKFIKELPDFIYVTPQEIVEHIKRKREQLREDYGMLNFSELRNICNLGDEATFDECLNVLCDYSNSIVVCGEKIPKPLFKIIEKLWRENQLLVFPPKKHPEYAQSLLDPTDPEYSVFEDFFEEYFKIKPETIRSQAISLAERIKRLSHNGIRLRSRIFEIIRLIPKIRYTPAINHDCKRYRKTPFDKIAYYTPNISSVKYVQERKSLPPRNISIRSLFSELQNTVNDGYVCPLTKEKLRIKKEFSSTALLEGVKIIQKALEDPELLGQEGALSEFQKNSIIHIFFNLFLDDSRCSRWCNESKCRLSKRNLTIVADTGAGKTLAFLIAPLIYIVYKHLEDPSFRMSQKPVCILIYPRRDLAFDQYINAKRICEVINRVAKGKVRLHVGQDYAGNIEYHGSIVASNIEAIKRRLADPSKNKYIDPDFLKIVVLDEMHLYSGILGLHIIYFLRRLGSFLKSKNYKQNHTFEYTYPLIIGASATIALPEIHSKKLFSLGYERPSQMDRYRKIWIENAIAESQRGKRALFHHIFLLPKKFANLLGTLTDLTSAVLHNNLDPNYPELYNEVCTKATKLTEQEKRRITKEIGKSLFFVDSISAIYRLAHYISDTEKRNLQVIDADNNQSRNFMCTTLYDKPLKFFPTMNLTSGNNINIYIPNLNQIIEGPLLCQFCKRQQNFNEISLVQYLEKGRNICAITFYGEKIHVSTILDGCYFFRSGLCWWFAVFPFITMHDNFIRSNEFTPDAIIPLRRTAQLREIMEEIKELDELFIEFLENPPYLKSKRLAIVSPVFEVGVDIANVRDVITFKTIRDLASYRQKTGRGGRELFSDTPVYTLISQRVLDRYIYRNPDIVADPSFLDPIPLKERNLFFLKSHVFMAIFDYLAIWSKEYSDIFHFRNFTRNSDYKKNNLLKYIENHKKDIEKYISLTFLCYATKNELVKLANDAVEEFKKRLNLFFSDIPSDLQSKLGILKPISESVENIDRKLLANLASKSKDPEEIMDNLKGLLGVS